MDFISNLPLQHRIVFQVNYHLLKATVAHCDKYIPCKHSMILCFPTSNPKPPTAVLWTKMDHGSMIIVFSVIQVWAIALITVDLPDFL